MRDIKFRGKDIETGEWRYGWLVRGECVYIISADQFFNAVVSPGLDMCTSCYRVDPATVCQFMWKHDRDGVEIYEGDWTESSWGYSGLVDIEGIMYAKAEGTISYDIVVCSNEHDTPEPWKEESDV